MGSGKHASYEESEFSFGRFIVIVVVLLIIAGIVYGIYSFMNKNKDEKIQETSVEENIEQNTYDVLGTIVIHKIGVEQQILDSVEDEALENGVIKLYGDTLNQERKFLYCRP